MNIVSADTISRKIATPFGLGPHPPQACLHLLPANCSARLPLAVQGSAGLPRQQIADRIGWSRDKVQGYMEVNQKVVADVLDYAKQHQTGRVTESVTGVTFTILSMNSQKSIEPIDTTIELNERRKFDKR